MTKGHLGRPPAEFGNPPTPTSQDLVNLVPSSTHLATWGSPRALGLCRLQRLQALHCRVSLIEVLGHQPWPEFQNFLAKHIWNCTGTIHNKHFGWWSIQVGSQQKPATSQLRSFRSEMSSLVSDFTHLHTSSHPLNLTDTNGYKWIRIWKMCFPDIFFSEIASYVKFKAAKFPRYPSTILTDHTDPEIWRYSLNWS